MNFFSFLALFGGLAMFLYGMKLMGNALKESASGTLKTAMEKVTNNPIKAFLLGLALTALIQSSTATIVITSGLVGAGIVSLHQSLGIIIGANVGTTVTGQIIRLLDVNADGSWLQIFQPSSLAPIALIIGIVLIMGANFKNAKSIGNICIGFGILFTGLMNMTSAVNSLTETGIIDKMFSNIGGNPFLGYLAGAAVAFVLQSSSATIGILQAFSASGVFKFYGVYAIIVGVYLGDCVTTFIVCSIGADKESKRVGIVNIIYNLCKSVLIIVGVAVCYHIGALDGLWNKTVNSGIIANVNTVYNLSCAVVLLPFIGVFERLSNRIIKDDPSESRSKYQDKIEALSPAFFNTPALALGSCYELLKTTFNLSKENIEKAEALLFNYNEKDYEKIVKEEDNIDMLTDYVSRYIVELLPHLQEENHIAILDEYYKVTSEFERLGDHALNIADMAKAMHDNGSSFSHMAMHELEVLIKLQKEILFNAGLAFEKRDINAAESIEPLVSVSDDMIRLTKDNHLKRMSKGECNSILDVSFTNLLLDINRIAAVCSNVGIAIVVRVHPELAQKEHAYYEKLHSGNNESYNRAYEKAYEDYLLRMRDTSYLEDVKKTGGFAPANATADKKDTLAKDLVKTDEAKNKSAADKAAKKEKEKKHKEDKKKAKEEKTKKNK